MKSPTIEKSLSKVPALNVRVGHCFFMNSATSKISDKRKAIQISQGLALDEKNNTLKKRALCLCDDGTI